MNPDFIQLRSLEGELKWSHKKDNYGLTLSTKELILHKPHVNYYFKLDDIVSIVPYDSKNLKSITIVNWRFSNQESTNLSTGSQLYKLYVKAATVHNRSGIFKMGTMDVIIPIHENMLKAISEYAGQTGLTTL
jgi:hypothetical protein